MKLRTKLIVLPQLILVIVIILMSVLISFYLIDGLFTKLEDEQVERNNNRLNAAVGQEISKLNNLGTDWAHWDDAHNFVHGEYPEFVDDNFEEGYLEKIDNDFMAFYDGDDKLFFLIQLDENGNQIITQEHFENIEFMKLKYLFENQSSLTGLTGLLKIENRTAMIAINEITNTDGSEAHNEYLMVGRYLDDELAQVMSEVIEFPINFYDYNSLDFRDFVFKKEYYVEKNKDVVKSYIVMNDVFGNAVQLGCINIDRSILKTGIIAVKYFIIFVALLSLIFIILSLLASKLLFKKIILQINKLQNSADEISKGNYDFELIESTDELGELSKSFKNMALQLKATRQNIDELNNKLEGEIKQQTLDLKNKLEDLERAKIAVYNMMDDLSESNIRLKQTDIAKTEFLNIVSHELKTPLTALVAHLDVIDDMKANLTEQELHSFEAIRRNASNLRMLIGNILEISRMESGKFELTKNKLNLGKIILDVADSLRILSKQKNIDIITEIEDLPEFEFDDSRLKEVMNNLITNAIKFTEQGSITIRARKEGDFVKVSVHDTGIGIPDDKVKNLFTKFYQVDASISRRYGGTGLGLSITKKIVEAHGGQMMVESKFGEGTTFSFTLPL